MRRTDDQRLRPSLDGEAFLSGLKRTTGSALLARNEQALFCEASLRVLAYILRRQPVVEA